MLKKGKKLIVVLLTMSIVLGGVCQVALADEPGANGFGDGSNIYENEDQGITEGDEGLIEDQTPGGVEIVNRDQNEENDSSDKGQQQPAEDENDEQEVIGDLSKYLDGFRFYNTDTDIDYDTENTVRDGDSVGIVFTFHIDSANDAEIKDGSVFTLPALPSNIEIEDSKIGVSHSMDENNIASWQINQNREIVVTFGDGVNTHYNNINGRVEIYCTASIIDEKTETIHFDLGEYNAQGKDFVIVYVPAVNTPEIKVTKDGKLNKNAGTITWTVKATANTNDRFASLAGYQIRDTFNKEELTLIKDSVTVGGIFVNVTDIEEGGFEYTFDKSFDKKEAVIQYQTSVNPELFASETEKSVENKVKLTMAGEEVSAEANKSIQVTDLYLWKNKGGKMSYDAATNTFLLTYHVPVRYSTQLEKVQVVDVIQNLKDHLTAADYTSVRVSYGSDKAPGNDSAWTELKQGGDYTIDESKKLTVNLDTSYSEALIEYTVRINDAKALSTVKNYTNYRIHNTAYLYLNGGEKAVKSDYENWDINIGSGDQIITFNKTGTFRMSDKIYVIEDGKYLIDWNIKINKAKKDLQGKITVTDTIGKGHVLDEKSVKFVDEKGIEYTELATSVNKNDSGAVVFTIEGLGARECNIRYTTKVNDFTHNGGTFKNEAVLHYEGIEDETINGTATIDYKNIIQKSGSYDAEKSEYDGTRYYNWKIVINDMENKFVLNHLKMTDTLPKDHKLVSGSIKVDGETIGTERSDSEPYYTINEKGYPVVHFPGTVKETKIVTISTSTDTKLDGITTIETKNIGHISADEFQSDLRSTGTAKVNYTPKLVKKTDYKNGETVNWEISINDGSNDSYITKQNATLIDELPPGLVYEEGSAKLLKKDGSVVDGLVANYETSSKTLTMTLPDGLDLGKAYKVVFATTVVENLKDISNTIIFDGTATEETIATSGSVTLKNSSLNGMISGDNIRFAIQKVDEKTNTPLSGAKFAIYNAKGEELQTVTSGEDGLLVFDKGLQYRSEYTVKELEAPEGYQLDSTPYKLIIGAFDKAKNGAEVTFNEETATFTRNSNNTLEIYSTITNKAEEGKPTPTPNPVPNPTPTPTPVPDPTPTPDPAPLPPDENLEDPEKPGDDDVLRPELPDDEHLEIEETTKNKKKDETKSANENPDLPQTGDNSQLILWMVLLITSLSAAAVIITYRRKVEKK